MPSVKRKPDDALSSRNNKRVKTTKLKPFWNDTSLELSRRLPSHTLSAAKWMKAARHWWFTGKRSRLNTSEDVPRITLPQSQIDDDDKPLLKAIRIRVYPTKEQKQIISKWFGVARWTYNQCANALNEDKSYNKKSLRSKFVNNVNFESENQWVTEVPASIRDEAMMDVLKAWKAYKAMKKENQNGFKLKFRSKRDDTQSIAVLSRHWGRKRGAYAQVFSKTKLKSYDKKHPLPEKLPHDSRLLMDRKKKYFLCIPIDREQYDTSYQQEKGKIVALDPGVRTFLTCYDQDGLVSEIAKGDRNRLFRLALHIDKLTAKKAKANKQSRYRMKKAIRRAHDKIRNLCDEMHKKTVNWLCENHQTILIPEFKSQDMTKKEGRRIHTKSVRSMLHWSHYRFRQRLLFKATEYPGVQVKVVKEDYTSKTCGNCGELNRELGRSKHFHCPSCNWQCDRDVNGARNILLKYLTENKTSLSVDGECLGHGPLVREQSSIMQNLTLLG